MTDFFSTAEVGKRMGVTPQRIQRLVKAGKLPAVRHGRCIRIPRKAWEMFLADQTAAAFTNMNEKGSCDANTV